MLKRLVADARLQREPAVERVDAIDSSPSRRPSRVRQPQGEPSVKIALARRRRKLTPTPRGSPVVRSYVKYQVG